MDQAEIFLYGPVESDTASIILDQVKAAGNKPILLRINSPGGDVFQGYAIYNALTAVPNVTTQIDGLAASIAAYIAMAGNPVRMADNAILMIHAASQSVDGVASDMRRSADLLDKVGSSITDAFVRKTGKPREQVQQMIDSETYMNAQEACDMGFVDEIIPPLALAADARRVFDNLDLSKAPAWVKAQAKQKKMSIKELKEKILAVFTGVDDAIEDTKAAVKYLVPDGNHLPYTDETGKPDHHLMGAAWAALHEGYRGNKYSGPDKEAAIQKLKQIYKDENMPLPGNMGMSGTDDTDVEAAIKTALAENNATLENATRQLAEAKAKFDSVASQLAEANTKITNLTTERDTFKYQSEKSLSEADDEKKLRGAIEAFAKSKGIDVKGIDKNAAVIQVPEGNSPEELIAKFEGLRGVEHTKFLRENKDALARAYAQVAAGNKAV